MPFRLTDAIFWISAICCAVAQAAILRSVIVAPVQAAGRTSNSLQRRATDIIWAVLPGLALVGVFVLTWRVMHGTHGAIVPPGTMQ